MYKPAIKRGIILKKSALTSQIRSHRRHIGMDGLIASGSVFVSTQTHGVTRRVGSNPAIGAIFPIYAFPCTIDNIALILMCYETWIRLSHHTHHPLSHTHVRNQFGLIYQRT